ncbi:MAG: hypothetical protein HON29_05055 [Candidatus Magasanikbacteria bacterium]|nr:hypothetical protein [Candidatus Magasanikbacteria bacterium]
MARKKNTVTPELRQEICDLYEQRNDKGKRIWTHRSLAKKFGLPKIYITAYLNGFANHTEYQKHNAQKAGFASYTEYRKHLLQKAGFASFTEYQKHNAQKAGFASLTEYQKHNAQKAGFASLTEYRKHLVQKAGFASLTEYNKHLAQKAGFASYAEYRKHNAQKAGFANRNEYQKHLAQKAGFASLTEYQNHRAQQRGFASFTEYRKHLAQKAGFANDAEYRKHLAQERGELEVFLLKQRLRTQLWNTLNRYTKHGKVQSSFEYGVDYCAIIASLELEAQHVHGKSIAELRRLGYHVDHIIPVSAYDLEDADEVARAYNPQNLRWLPGVENIAKSAKLILDLILQVPSECHPKKWTTLGIDWHAVNAYVDVTLCAGVSGPFFGYAVSEQVRILINTHEDVIHFGGPEVHIVVDGEIINDDIEEVYDEEFFSHDCEEVAS